MRPLVFADLGAARCSGKQRTLKVIIEVQLADPCLRLDPNSYALAYADIYIGQQQSDMSVQSQTWKHLFCWLTQVPLFMWAQWVGVCENVRFPALPSTTCVLLHRKHIAHQKQLDLLSVSVCPWSGFLSHTYTQSFTHTRTHEHTFFALFHVHTTQTPHTHP